MQLEGLTKEDELQIYKVCKAGDIPSNDPMVLILMEWQKLKNQILSTVNGRAGSMDHLVQQLREESSSIGESLETQRSIATVLDEQLNFVKWFKFRFLSMWVGVSLAIGLALGISGTILYQRALNYEAVPHSKRL